MITQRLSIRYNYFNDYYKMIAIDLSKQQALDADRKAIQQIKFTANADRYGNTTMLLIIEKAKETILDLSQGTMKVLWMCSSVLFSFNVISK